MLEFTMHWFHALLIVAGLLLIGAGIATMKGRE